jgi:hypothetical protein
MAKKLPWVGTYNSKPSSRDFYAPAPGGYNTPAEEARHTTLPIPDAEKWGLTSAQGPSKGPWKQTSNGMHESLEKARAKPARGPLESGEP